MCDYSLHNVASRPAKVGDKVISAKFSNSITGGFAAAGEPDVAALEFPNGEIVLVTMLREGLTATVLQLPADPEKKPAVEIAVPHEAWLTA